jgi:hypothetical protein
VGYRKQQEKKRIDISEIVQILRTTNLQQFRGEYYEDGKSCAVGTIIHEKYGWNRDCAIEYESSLQQLVALNHGMQ